MKVGTIIRNEKVAQWGMGVLVSGDEAWCTVRFEVAGEKSLQIAKAKSHWEEIVRSNVPPNSPLLDPARWSELRLPADQRTKHARTRQSVPCPDCSKPLRRSVYSKDGALKSCPNCSGEHGKHVFYAYPDAFGTSAARATDDTPDGAQSHCFLCRGRGDPRIKAVECGSVVK